ncbi:hypothetical protein PFICI_13021 [Pestalotiopsis fici W106-1]|uniref:SWIRM domain-containing protein n=1 Tax=Pestalotiopsis fici (strain W106-1 / CGMCC3.15140) TaxID=1229662 RepID=W3WMZ2_PESFW|nr:uncharacterized protein PFICI_13021 [Pestalotiopsis fici W106-1]ETS74537.1 hypothetical protein PFICI_13021 [Pestalotiopsis fici W106-1]
MSTSKTGAEATKPLDISNLMSPPELPPMESFAHSTTVAKATEQVTSNVRKAHGPNPPLSPPISPLTKVDHSVAASTRSSTPVKDPILYPSHELSPTQPPLFGREDSVETRRVIDLHVESRPTDMFKQVAPPRLEDYQVIMTFQSRVMELYKKDPRAWYKHCREQALIDRKEQWKYNRHKQKPILPAKPQPIRNHVQRVVKPSRATNRPLQASAPAPRPIRAASPTAPPQRQVISRINATPDPASRRVTAPSREDKDFNALPDYCPPLSSLPAKANSLKVDWKGAPIDLNSDPNRHLLHPDELLLAANLRLDAATYLTSKRRMFMARLDCLKIKKEFRKTDAQQACKIDVNKASKLWTAFDKVGWLEQHWVARFA